MEHFGTTIAIIGVAGIAAQWISWRFGLPAIVILSVAGILVGPVLGIVVPDEQFGELLRPAISAAVAIILFEGGLTLNFAEIRETSRAVWRVVLVGGPLTWTFGAFAAHYLGGLSWETSIVMAGLLVVTGPTVIIPLLRQAQLTQRPSSVIRWEAIINDPIGALYAVLAFEILSVMHGELRGFELATRFGIGMLAAIVGGFLLGRFVAFLFVRGHVPEYLKSPFTLVFVLGAHAATNLILEEAGLVTVTIMGITLANSRIASLGDMRRFKETLTILLVSGVFILLTATLNRQALASLDLRAALFIVALLFVVRPVAIFLATVNSDLKKRERLLIGWIAPRGIVAVAVAGLFGAALLDIGIEDGPRMVPITFAVVFATVVLHGFSLKPLARRLKLVSAEEPGLLIVGASRFTVTLAEKLIEMNIPVLIADRSFNRLRTARLAKIPTYYGEILSEAAEHAIERNRYGHVLAASDNDDYNALVCTSFAPEFGSNNVLQIGRLSEEEAQDKALTFTIGGRTFISPDIDFWKLEERITEGWVIQSTRMTEEYSFIEYRADRDGRADILFVEEADGTLSFATPNASFAPEVGDTIVALVKKEPKARRAEAEREAA